MHLLADILLYLSIGAFCVGLFCGGIWLALTIYASRNATKGPG
jgi:hypothetical protein